MPHDLAPSPTLNPDSLYAFCQGQIQAQQHMVPALSSIDMEQLLWSITVSCAHALETAARVFGALRPSEQSLVMQLATELMKAPTHAGLYDLWDSWRSQHPDWGNADTLEVPIYFLSCSLFQIECRRELAQRRRSLNRPVFNAWVGLVVDRSQPDAVRQQRFLDAIDATLRTTVNRRLRRTQEASYEEDSSANTDAESMALLGVVAREHRARAVIVELFRSARSIPTDSGHSIEVLTIPMLPMRGMDGTDGLNGVWRTAANDVAFGLLAKIAPGVLGILETALPDAAHRAQRAERDRAAAKKRGGTGGRKANKAGTAEPAAQHVSIGVPDEDDENDSDSTDPETLADDRLSLQQTVEAQENAKRALRIAIDRWGESGRAMLEVLVEGQTKKDAAKVARISEPAVTKRIKTLKNLLNS